jgi:predicted  nucleic acid-binding Zn-ribbon protein
MNNVEIEKTLLERKIKRMHDEIEALMDEKSKLKDENKQLKDKIKEANEIFYELGLSGERLTLEKMALALDKIHVCLKQDTSIANQSINHDGDGDSERAKTHMSLNCRNDEAPSQKEPTK